uniref:DUF834 domain-containing protein n=1 Tax=Oryza rufipogon TaxID=4529 RepID=A0A0E0QPF0_ORYRU
MERLCLAAHRLWQRFGRMGRRRRGSHRRNDEAAAALIAHGWKWRRQLELGKRKRERRWWLFIEDDELGLEADLEGGGSGFVGDLEGIWRQHGAARPQVATVWAEGGGVWRRRGAAGTRRSTWTRGLASLGRAARVEERASAPGLRKKKVEGKSRGA